MQHMTVWPRLRCLTVESNGKLSGYTFDGAAARFSSLTSLTTNSCSDAAIVQLLRLPALEELHFFHYTRTLDEGGCVQTTERGFRTLSQAASLRSVVYSAPDGHDHETPRLVSLAAPAHHQPPHTPHRHRLLAERASASTALHSAPLCTPPLPRAGSSVQQRLLEHHVPSDGRRPCCRSSSRTTSCCPAGRCGRLHELSTGCER